ncbi:hypothetical protein ACLOJK_037435 [Asimina triloba]
MVSRRGLISSNDMVLIRSRYQIPDNIELLASEPDKTLCHHQPGCICLNEFMCKVGVRLPFEFKVVAFCRISTLPQSTSLLIPGRSSSRWCGFVNGESDVRTGIPNRWVKKLPEAVVALVEELEANQWLVLAHLQANNLQWFPSKEAFFDWCQNSVYPDASAVLREKKKRHALKRPHLSMVEELVREEEANLQMVMTLSLEMARCVISSLEAPAEPDHSRTTDFSSAGSLDGIPITTEKRRSARGKGAPRVIIIEEVGDLALTLTSMGEPEPPVCLEVLIVTFGEPSRAKVTRRFFWCPFDMEGWALKILGDLVPMQLMVVRENTVMGFLDKDGRGPTKLMLQELLSHVWQEFCDLERRIHSINGCFSQEKYRYHVLGKFPPLIARDCIGRLLVLDNTPRSQGSHKFPRRSCTLIPSPLSVSVWRPPSQRLCLKLAAGWRKSLRLRTTKGEQSFFYELQEMGRRANPAATLEVKAMVVVEDLRQDLYAARLEQGHLKEDMAKLLAYLVVAKAERDKVVGDVEVSSLAKRDLKKALVEANTEGREKVSRLSAKLIVAKSKGEALQARAVGLDADGAESGAKLDAARGDILILHR